MTTLGLDLSLTNTGVCILSEKEHVLRNIKSKPQGDTPVDELLRIKGILSDIEDIITDGEYEIELVAIEGLAFMARNTTALVQLSALNYLTRNLLYEYNKPFVIVAPTSLKKFITGKGVAPKDTMMLEVYKRYNTSILDNNTCDAFALAQCAMAFTKGEKLPKYQEEVIALLDKQIQPQWKMKQK